MKKKTGIWGLLIILAVTALLGGCQKKESETKNSNFTGDEDAIRIFVRKSSTYEEALKKQFPDVKFDFYHYGGLNPSMMMYRLLEEDDMGDICFSSLQATDEAAKNHLLDLSGYSFCGKYEPSILSQFDVEGKIYQIPGFITMRTIIYNKKMFEEHGWEVPKSFDELTALCRQIREETPDITPIVMGAAAGGYYFTTMTSYAQSEFLYTPEGQKWTRDYQAGKAKAEDGFGEGIEMVQELIDAGAFDHDKNEGLWDGPLFRERMVSGEAAMMFFWGGHEMIAEQLEGGYKEDFEIMPFRNREGQAFIGTNIPYYIGLSKELGEKGNEKKLKQALEIMDWLSTEEGMSALSEATYSSILPLKNIAYKEGTRIFQNFWNENLDSIKAPMLYAGYEDIIVPVADVIIEAVKGERRLDGLSGYIDEIHQEYLKDGADGISVGSFTRDFTHEETVEFFAHVLHSTGDCDIAMVSDGNYKDGILNLGGVYGHFLEGSIIEDEMTCSLPGMINTAEMVRMTLTGSQIKELVEKGKEVDTVSFDYYWAGMEVKWKDGKAVSIILDDGRELTDDMTCTIAFAFEDYNETVAALGNPEPLPYTTLEVFAKYLKDNSPVSPAGSSR